MPNNEHSKNSAKRVNNSENGAEYREFKSTKKEVRHSIGILLSLPIFKSKNYCLDMVKSILDKESKTEYTISEASDIVEHYMNKKL